jgi:WD40 repeat protein
MRTWSRNVVLPVRAFTHDGWWLQTMEFQPSGQHLLTTTDRGLMYVWDWQREAPLPWAAGFGPLSAVCWKPDGTELALGWPSGSVELRSVPSGEVRWRFQHRDAITALAFTQDGRQLAVASDVVRVWDCQAKALAPGEWPHPQPVDMLVFNQRGDRLVTGCRDQLARVFAWTDPKAAVPLYAPLQHREAPERRPIRPAFIGKDLGLVTIRGPREMTWRDAETGRPTGLGKVRLSLDSPSGVVASHDGRSFAIGGYYGPQVWNVADKSPAGRLLQHANNVSSYAFSPDDRALLTASWDLTAKLWSWPGAKLLGYPVPHQDMVIQAAFAPDGHWLATGQKNGLVRIWRRPAANPGVQGMPAAHLTAGLKPSRDGRYVVPCRFANSYGAAPIHCPQLRVYDLVAGQPTGAALEVTGECIDVALAGDGRTAAAVVAAESGGRLYLWDFQTGKPFWAPRPVQGDPLSVAFNGDDTRLAVLCKNGQVLVADPRDGRSLAEFGLPDWGNWDNYNGQFRLQFGGDGALLVLHTDYKLHVVDPMTGRPRYAPLRAPRPGWSAGFATSPDGRLVALGLAGAEDNPVQVWELATGQPQSAFLPHPDVPYGFWFSPDGRRLFTGCRDGQARLWDVASGKLVCPPCKVDDEVFGVALTPDGHWGLTATRKGVAEAGKVQMWEFTTGKPVSPVLHVGRDSAQGLAVSPDGSQALTSILHGGLYWIDLRPLSASDDLSLEDQRTLAELAAGQRIHDGDLAGLTSEEWLARWRAFRQRCPGYASPLTPEPSP